MKRSIGPSSRSLLGSALLSSSLALVGALGLAGCHKNSPSAPASETAGGPAAPMQSRSQKGLGFRASDTGLVTYLIDAPVEKGKGKWTKVRGEIFVDPSDLTATSGHVDIDLDDLTTYTFDDLSKNTTQTTHAHNWLEIGKDVSPEVREKNRWAVFNIQRIEGVSNARLADAPEKGGVRTVTLTSRGDFSLHGVHAQKTIKLSVAFGGPATAPTSITVKTTEPFAVSLSEHDVKPRDVVGKFLSGALEVVVQNKKIVDTAFVSVQDITLRPQS